ncbi:MAG: nitrogenase cofactor biosynthesis protein NifB, partial [Methanomassiliicoccaceae archaeon]|nr:nitrogenase cofactor biosynthesis protein NifB [Methanomassiliicoccaceae archaeon]
VRKNGKTFKGKEGAEILLKNQLDGIEKCVKLGMLVKINIVMVPGINDSHIPELVKKVKSLGAYIVNILPLIPVEGTKFSDRRAPTPEERKRLMDKCEVDAKMMRHCRQCRADAVGLLGEDRSSEFAGIGKCSTGCGPLPENSVPVMMEEINEKRKRRIVALATSDGKNIDSGFGNASRFDVYSISDDGVKLIRTVTIDTTKQVAGSSHRDHIVGIIDQMRDCSVFVVKEIGHMPSRILAERNVIVRISQEKIGHELFATLRW